MPTPFDERLYQPRQWPCGCRTRWQDSPEFGGPHFTAIDRCDRCPPPPSGGMGEEQLLAIDEINLIRHLADVWDMHLRANGKSIFWQADLYW